jgi:hypothetical protein
MLTKRYGMRSAQGKTTHTVSGGHEYKLSLCRNPCFKDCRTKTASLEVSINFKKHAEAMLVKTNFVYCNI